MSRCARGERPAGKIVELAGQFPGRVQPDLAVHRLDHAATHRGPYRRRRGHDRRERCVKNLAPILFFSQPINTPINTHENGTRLVGAGTSGMRSRAGLNRFKSDISFNSLRFEERKTGLDVCGERRGNGRWILRQGPCRTDDCIGGAGEWANGRANGRVGGRAGERAGEWANGRVGERASGRTGEWANGRASGRAVLSGRDGPVPPARSTHGRGDQRPDRPDWRGSDRAPLPLPSGRLDLRVHEDSRDLGPRTS